MAKKKTTKKAPVKSRAKGSQEWPKLHKNGVLYRPDRAAYLKRARNKETRNNCVFCDALKSGVGVESLLLFQDEHGIVVMNKFPYNSGHLLVLPRRHCAEMGDLSETEYGALMLLFRRTIDAVRSAYECHGLNVGANLGAAAGAGIPQHLHFHVIPRWNGDVNFFPLVAQTKVLPETLEQAFERLLPYFR